MKKTLLSLFVLAALLTALPAQAQETVIATQLPYGETLEFTVELASGQDSVYVDWGDGKRLSYHDGEKSWHSNTWVHGKLLSDTIKMYGAIEQMDIDEKQLTVLQFKNQPQLTQLYADNNKLTNEGLDLTGCPNLQTLDLSHNDMTYMNLKSLGSLEFFDISDNPYFNSAVFASGNSNLRQIDMDNCDIVHFYPVRLPNLMSLSINNGSLMDIDLAGGNYPNLSSLNLAGNGYLSDVNVTELTKLENLSLSGTAVSIINISQNTELTSLSINNTKVNRLNLKNNKKLTSLNVTACPISKLDVRGLTNLQYIHADSTKISRLDLSDKRFVRKVSVRGTNIEFLDMHPGIGYNRLSSLDIRDCKGFTAQTLNFTFDAMPPHEGDSYGTNVFLEGTAYEHANTKLLNYDSSNYYNVDHEGDGTASMDSITIVQQKTDGGTYTLQQEGTSTDQGADGNYFPFRPVSASGKVMPGYPLKVIAEPAEGYELAGVEVNGKFFDDSLCVASTEGTIIRPVFRKLMAGDKIVLTVKGGSMQQYFLGADAVNTQITVDWGDGVPVPYNISTKHTAVYNDNGAQGSTVTITGPVTYADFSSYPGGFGTDNQITGMDLSGNSSLRALITYMNPIGKIDVSHMKDLEMLDCSYCELETLDVSNNTKLDTLRAYGNYLESIDVTKLPNLRMLELRNNMLSTIDLSKNPDITELGLQNNELTSLDVKHLTDLVDFSVQNNQLTALDLSNNKKLIELNVSQNKFTTLDLSALTELRSLYAGDSPLEMLDLSKNTQLNYIYVSSNAWDACTLNDFYYLLPQYPRNYKIGDLDEKMRLRVVGNTSTEDKTKANDAAHAESVIATGKGWTIDQKGDGTGCDMAYVTLLPMENGSATMSAEDGSEVKSGQKVKKNSVVTVNATPAANYVVESIKANGKVAADGKFTVKAATEVLVQFTFSTGIEGVNATSTTVSGGNGELTVSTSAPVRLAVYTLSGAQLFADTVADGDAIALKPGVYVVKIGQQARKIRVR